MNKILFLISVLFIVSCGNKPNKKKSDCKNIYENENFEFCLPSENWKSKKVDKFILFENDLNDSLTINQSVISIVVDDYKKEISAEKIRDDQMESMMKDKDLNINLISKGQVKINGKTFYDYEITAKSGEIYSYFLFYHKGNNGYYLSASIGEKIRNGINKKDYLKFFQTLKIK